MTHYLAYKKAPIIRALLTKPNITSQRISAAAHIPMEIIKKNITSSNDDRTGFLNLTIDRAPIIPSESAILVEITLVMAKVMIGKSMRVIVPAKVLIQFCW